ncbi:MAG: hypothetical protein EZS28_030923, partial [Streblomastix strix]
CEGGGQDIGNCRDLQHTATHLSHTRYIKQDSRLIEQISNIRRLYDQPADTQRSTPHSESQTFNRSLLKQKEQKIQEVRKYDSRKLGRSSGQSIDILERRSLIYPSSNSSYTSGAEQIRERKDNCIDGRSKLAIPIMVVELHEVDLEIVNRGKKRRCVNTRWEDEEIKKIPSSRRNDRVIIRGNIGEDLFRWTLEQRELAAAATDKVIEGWHII